MCSFSNHFYINGLSKFHKKRKGSKRELSIALLIILTEKIIVPAYFYRSGLKMEVAREMGIKKIYAEVLNVNRAMCHLLQGMGFSMRKDGMGVNYFERGITDSSAID